MAAVTFGGHKVCSLIDDLDYAQYQVAHLKDLGWKDFAKIENLEKVNDDLRVENASLKTEISVLKSKCFARVKSDWAALEPVADAVLAKAELMEKIHDLTTLLITPEAYAELEAQRLSLIEQVNSLAAAMGDATAYHYASDEYRLCWELNRTARYLVYYGDSLAEIAGAPKKPAPVAPSYVRSPIQCIPLPP